VVGGIAEEERLRRHHQVLQALDRLSLGLCCEQVPFPQFDLVPRDRARAVCLRFERTGDWAMRVTPWPFDERELRLTMPVRRIDVRSYSQDELPGCLAAAPASMIDIHVHQ
jgi:hypothetical protein